MKRFPIAIASTLLLAALQTAVANPKVVELTYEAATSMVSLPPNETGELTFQACDTCKVLRLRATANTRYQIGERYVTLAELKSYLASNPQVGMAVAQLNGTNELSRIVAPALPK